MKIYFLGTNGWFDTKTGNTICTLIETRDSYIILDAGIGIFKADRYMKTKKPVYLFLSHFHHDHIFGLHALLKFRFKSLQIIGQPGTTRTVREYLDKKYSAPLSMMPYKTKVTDIKEGWHKTPVTFQALKLKHASQCYGYRFKIEGKTITYCTDTGYCNNSVALSRNADLLISECSLAPGQQTPGWPHMNPELAAKLAIESGAKKLVLTHFDAEVYTTMPQRTRAEKIAKKLFLKTVAAKDGTVIEL